MLEIDSEVIMFPRNSEPYGKSWENWAADWCNWLLSIPRDKNPANDETGINCFQNQADENVWFLAGTFGNYIPVRRKCIMPEPKAFLFPIANKEDSFAEDIDIKEEAFLSIRAREELLSRRASTSMDRLIQLQLTIDGKRVLNLKKYRVLSLFFDLTFPEDNIYNVKPGLTRSVCDGYWAFLKPLPIGFHEITFSAEIFLPKDDPVTIQIKNCPIHGSVTKEKNKNSIFKIGVTYEMTIK